MSTSVVGEPGSTGYDRTGWFSSDYNVHDLNVTLEYSEIFWEYSGIFWNILEIVFYAGNILECKKLLYCNICS